ncbi:dihydroorotase [candidate division KSB1 bacterium]
MSKSKPDNSAFLLQGGRIVDPANGVDQVGDLGVNDGVIVDPTKLPPGHETVEAAGMVVMPGLIDMHVHLREPGREDEETVASGTRAAVWGGFTTVVAMPNTEPPIDNVAGVEFILDRARTARRARVLTTACITKGRAGEELAELADMARAGAVGFTDDGDSVRDSHIMRRALEYAKMTGKPIINHAEDHAVAQDGVMNEGIVSTRLGLGGIPSESEEIIIDRDIMLARLADGRLHETHISTGRGLDLIRAAKADGLKVTCDCTPHHLFLDEEAVIGFDPDYKMKPPLRTKADCEALIGGLMDGSIDAVASDHAPHSWEEKDVEFDVAPFGSTGLETTLSLMITHLVKTGRLDYPELARLLTAGPAAALGLPAPSLSPGSVADVTIVNPDISWTVVPGEMISLSGNTAFKGQNLSGRAWYLWVDGRLLLHEGNLVPADEGGGA